MFLDNGVKLKDFGIQLQNIGNQIYNFGFQIQMQNNFTNFGIQIQNKGYQITNIGNELFNLGNQICMINQNIMNFNQLENMNMINMMNQNINMQKINQFQNIGFNYDNEKSIVSSDKKINLIFQTQNGLKTNIIVECHKTVEEAIKLYMDKIGKQIEDNVKEKLYFMYNGEKMDIYEKRKVGDFFKIENEYKDIKILVFYREVIG